MKPKNRIFLVFRKLAINLMYRIGKLSPWLYFKLMYFRYRRRFPNFKDPQDISEIVLSQMLSGEICRYTEFSDKLKVRKHFEEWGFGEYLPKLHGVWKSADDIDFDALPEAFALKTNHGWGCHYLCPDKSMLNAEEARERIRKAMRTQFGEVEKQYRDIEPLCYAEEHIPDLRGGGQPLDYKFMCCDGEIRCVLVCSERDAGTRLAAYDLEWNRLDWIWEHKRSTHEFERPKTFDRMKEIAGSIAKKFLQVRVDMYCLPDGKIYLGELTFSPCAGTVSSFTNEAIRLMGHKRHQCCGSPNAHRRR